MKRFLGILVLFIILGCVVSFFILWRVLSLDPAAKFVKNCFLFYAGGLIFLSGYFSYRYVKRIQARLEQDTCEHMKEKENEIERIEKEAQKRIAAAQEELERKKEEYQKEKINLGKKLREIQLVHSNLKEKARKAGIEIKQDFSRKTDEW